MTIISWCRGDEKYVSREVWKDVESCYAVGQKKNQEGLVVGVGEDEMRKGVRSWRKEKAKGRGVLSQFKNKGVGGLEPVNKQSRGTLWCRYRRLRRHSKI